VVLGSPQVEELAWIEGAFQDLCKRSIDDGIEKVLWEDIMEIIPQQLYQLSKF